MSTDIAEFQKNLPAEVRERIAKEVADDIGRLGSIGGKDTIRVTQDKRFELPTGEVLDKVNCVIVDFVYRNEYYLGKFNRKDIQAPKCFAISPEASTMAPSDLAEMKQHDGPCATCQWNAFGSSPDGDGKACKNTVMLGVLPEGAGPDHPIWVIKTSPTAIRHFNAHVAKVGRNGNATVGMVVTEVSFDPSVTYASLRFDMVAPNKELMQTMDRKGEARARLMRPPEANA